MFVSLSCVLASHFSLLELLSRGAGVFVTWCLGGSSVKWHRVVRLPHPIPNCHLAFNHVHMAIWLFNSWTREVDFNTYVQHSMWFVRWVCLTVSSWLQQHLLGLCLSFPPCHPPGWYTRWVQSRQSFVHSQIFSFLQPRRRPCAFKTPAGPLCVQNHGESRQTTICWFTLSGFNNISFSFLLRLLGCHFHSFLCSTASFDQNSMSSFALNTNWWRWGVLAAVWGPRAG